MTDAQCAALIAGMALARIAEPTPATIQAEVLAAWAVVREAAQHAPSAPLIPPPGPRDAPRMDALILRVAAECPEYASDYEAAGRASANPDALAMEIGMQLAGAHLPAGMQATLPVVGQALRDIAVSGERLSAHKLRWFVASLLRGDTTRDRPRPAAGAPDAHAQAWLT